MGKILVNFSVKNPKKTIFAVLLFTIFLGFNIPKINIDTDPENMLNEEEFVRVFHNKVKKDFTLHDFVVLGVVNEKDSNGVFNPETLNKINNITEEIKKIDGVIIYDIMSLSSVDNISQGSQGSVKFEWLLKEEVKSDEKAAFIRKESMENPMLKGTLFSEDGLAAAIYIPIEKKDISHRVSREVYEITSKYSGDEKYFITGLPVAEDTFGIEMFKQMAISAPLAGLIIFFIMWYFFKRVTLIMSPMFTSMISIISTMGLMIGMGFTVHIMSSMIPIFLMPISVVDSVHILSQFFDMYDKEKKREEIITEVMDELLKPMLYTSITTAVGFLSLAFTPIPPVRIFGFFIAFGVMTAWFLTVTFIPAYLMLMKEKSLEGFGAKHNKARSKNGSFINMLGNFSTGYAKVVILSTLTVIALSVYGISKININDNPVKWFEPDHNIRVSDRVLNKHFGGTYTAYLVLEGIEDNSTFKKHTEGLTKRLISHFKEEEVNKDLSENIYNKIEEFISSSLNIKEFKLDTILNKTSEFIEKRMENADGDELDSLETVLDFIEDEKVNIQLFKQPKVLKYIEDIQKELIKTGIVGKSTSVVDVVKKVHYELMGGDKKYSYIPKSNKAIGQVLISFQNSHDPDDLWHFVTKDYNKANIWVQLKSGDNKDMQIVVSKIQAFLNKTKPENIETNWAGLTYINTVWQDKMVKGMLKSLMGSFIIVFIMMIILFRSFVWGFLAMIPLSATITLIYGLIGFSGKDYDMPTAVLSSLTLGLSIDFAIHFLENVRSEFKKTKSWKVTVEKLFDEPARAISKNAVIIAIGFLPLFAANLMPYKTVGFFMFSIMAVSCAATLIILPALIELMSGFIFSGAGNKEG